MSVELRIHYTGLCLYVPDPDGSGRPPGTPRLHVLLLKHHHVHYPRLVYDIAHECEGANDVKGRLRCRALNDRVLMIDGFGDPIDPARGFGNKKDRRKMPRQIVDLDTIANVGTLDRKYVEPRPFPDATVAARVTTHVGAFSKHPRGPWWTVKGGPHDLPNDSLEAPRTGIWPRRITTLVEWKVKAKPGESPILRFHDLRQEGEPFMESLTLHPVKGAIDLWIFNVTMDLLPPPKDVKPPQIGEPAEHFEAYYEIFGKIGDIPVLATKPRFKSPPQIPSDCRPSTTGTTYAPGTVLTPITHKCTGGQAALARSASANNR